MRDRPERFILFCDDLSFDGGDASYKSLKAALEGGIEGRPENVVFYATSNRRHLLPRDMIENERSTAINPSEAVQEKVSLSDRFGLWLGFHMCSQDQYLAMVDGYLEALPRPGGAVDVGARGAGMVDDPRQPLRPRRLAVRAGPCRADRVSGWAEGQPSDRCEIGSTGVASLRSSKCTCGVVTPPDMPESATIWPRRIFSPRFTFSSLLWA